MPLSSPSYFLFLPVVYLAFLLAKDRFRLAVLLAASYGFYLALGAPQLPLLLALVTFLSYMCALRMAASADPAAKRRVFLAGTAACALLLICVKYLPRLLEGSMSNPPPAPLLVTVGASYFIFQAISYLADVYLGVQEVERHFGRYALSMAFFPKLLQGPIERAGDLLPQLNKRYEFDYSSARSGLILLACGLFKKVVAADRLALYADPVFNDVHAYSGVSLLVAVYAYSLQIYFDFSGYTDMARGTARLFGIDLTENFNSPYSAVSIADFWRRWHISFSRWILDYIFKPLQMLWRERREFGTAAALLVTFLASGVWHGAAWGFVIWGLLHGVWLAASVYWRPRQKKLHRLLGLEKSGLLRAWQIFVTFHLVSFAWIFFRADSLSDAFYVAGNLLDFSGNSAQISAAGIYGFFKTSVLMGTQRRELVFLAAALCVCAASGKERIELLRLRPFWVKWTVYNALLAAILILWVSKETFIYFRF